MQIIFILMGFAGLLLSSQASNAHDGLAFYPLQEFAILETQHNPMHRGSEEAVDLEHIEIPLSALRIRQLEGQSESFRRSLVRSEHGTSVAYRWIFHPDDRVYREQILAQVRVLRGLPPGTPLQTEKFFRGYRTASRSLVVMDPQHQVSFSLKTSTDQAAGIWRDKPQPVRYAEAAVLISEHIRAMREEWGEFKYAVILEEPLAALMDSVDQAQIVRDLGTLPTGESTFVPLFSILSDGIVEKLIEMNELTEAELFEKIGFIWGRAQAEVILKTGIAVSSAHAQNFLIEVSPEGKLTGRMVFRDFADAHLLENFVRGPVKKRLEDHWIGLRDSNNEIFQNWLAASFMPYHGLQFQKTPAQLRIFDGIRKGFLGSVKRAAGPWGMSLWKLDERSLEDQSGVLFSMSPHQKDLAREIIRNVRRQEAQECSDLLILPHLKTQQ